VERDSSEVGVEYHAPVAVPHLRSPGARRIMTASPLKPLPCPFCGAELLECIDASQFRWRHPRSDGTCFIPSLLIVPPEDLDRWNRRVPAAEDRA